MHKARVTAGRQGLLPCLVTSDAAHPPQLNVGCSGWFYWHWRGAFYPQDIPTKRWFAHYAVHFRTVELNARFLLLGQPWLPSNLGGNRVTQKNFIYTIKVCELITHIKRFQGTKRLIADFCFIANLLGPTMGCFLFQLPPSFHYTPTRLKRILLQLDHDRRNVVEFRHASWWNQTKYLLCFSQNWVISIFCSVSGPRLPDQLVKTADDLYIRFHGQRQWYRHDYSAKELAVWTDRIRKSGAVRVWAYFNNDQEGYAIKNATSFMRQNARAFRM